jgi:hypothetical protein
MSKQFNQKQEFPANWRKCHGIGAANEILANSGFPPLVFRKIVGNY